MNRDVAMETFIQITKHAEQFVGFDADYVKPRMVEHASKIIGPLEFDDYKDFINITTTPKDFWRRIFIEARDMYTSEKLKPPVPKSVIANMSLEEREKLEHEKLTKFFFRKDNKNERCDCGAAYTDFPNVHQSYCKLSNHKHSAVDLDFWD